MQGNVEQDMKSPRAENPRKFLAAIPDCCCQQPPDDEAMRDVVTLMNERWEYLPVRTAPLVEVKRAEREKIRGHAEQQCASPLPSGFPSEQHASPKSMCQDVHVEQV